MRFPALGVVLLGTTLASCGPDAPSGAVPTGHAGHSGGGAHGGHVATAGSPAVSGAGPPPGYTNVDLTAERVQLFGVRTTPATREALRRTVRTVGVVRTDETRESHVHVKWNGWIEEFFVSFVGQRVKKGDPLFAVYSPDLLTAQQELTIAARRAAAGEDPSAEALLAASRRKLQLWDVPEEAIAEIERTGKVRRTVVVGAPRDGTVVKRDALPGMYVEPAMDLYTVADLSRVWVVADIYEFEAPTVRVGQPARFIPVGAPPREIRGEIAFVAPTVDVTTRTVKVRLDVANDDGSLRPGAYGTILVDVEQSPEVVVPSDAVIDTGVRSIVFVASGAGRFEPRAVKVGIRAAGNAQVLEGLKEGELVVTRAQFLLDSESRIRGGPAGPGHAAHGR